MTMLIGLAMIFASMLVGLAVANVLISFEKRISINALHHYRRNRAHVRYMKRSRERGARLRRG